MRISPRPQDELCSISPPPLSPPPYFRDSLRASARVGRPRRAESGSGAFSGAPRQVRALAAHLAEEAAARPAPRANNNTRQNNPGSASGGDGAGDRLAIAGFACGCAPVQSCAVWFLPEWVLQGRFRQQPAHVSKSLTPWPPPSLISELARTLCF